MSSTGTTILGWTAHVSRSAKIVRVSGGNADQGAELAVLIKGLLPEFAPIKLILNQKANPTLAVAIPILMDYARQENLLELSKGAHVKPRTNTYAVDDNPRAPKDRPGRPQGPMDDTFFCVFF